MSSSELLMTLLIVCWTVVTIILTEQTDQHQHLSPLKVFTETGSVTSFIITDTPFACFLGIGFHLCVHLCSKRPMCTAVKYNKNWMKCGLLFVEFEGETSGFRTHATDGTIMADIFDWSPRTADACADTCTGALCLMTRKQDGRCIPKQGEMLVKGQAMDAKGKFSSMDVSFKHNNIIYLTKGLWKFNYFYAFDFSTKILHKVSLSSPEKVGMITSAMVGKDNEQCLLWVSKRRFIMKLPEPSSFTHENTMIFKRPRKLKLLHSLTNLDFRSPLLIGGNRISDETFRVDIHGERALMSKKEYPMFVKGQRLCSKFDDGPCIQSDPSDGVLTLTNNATLTHGITFLKKTSVFAWSVAGSRFFAIVDVQSEILSVHHRVCYSSAFSSGRPLTSVDVTDDIIDVAASMAHKDVIYFVRARERVIQFFNISTSTVGKLFVQFSADVGKTEWKAVTVGPCSNLSESCIHILLYAENFFPNFQLWNFPEPTVLTHGGTYSVTNSLIIRDEIENADVSLIITPLGSIFLLAGNTMHLVFSNTSSNLPKKEKLNFSEKIPISIGSNRSGLSTSLSPDGSEMLVLKAGFVVYYKIINDGMVVPQDPKYLRYMSGIGDMVTWRADGAAFYIVSPTGHVHLYDREKYGLQECGMKGYI